MHTKKYVLEVLKSIAWAVFNGKMSGSNPIWQIDVGDFGEKNLSRSSYYHFAECILMSYTSGEIVEKLDNSEVLTGYWNLKIKWKQQKSIFIYFEEDEILQVIREFEQNSNLPYQR